MKQYKLVIFDVDGTLLDTTEGIAASVRYTVDRFGFAPLSEEQLRSFIGPPIQNSFARTYGLSGPVLQEIATVFRDRYKSTDLLKAVPYEGIYEVFTGLHERNIRTAIATYKREDYAIELMRHFHFDEYTDVIHGADHENKLKKSDIIRLCMREVGADTGETLMIGDTDNDAAGAQRIGVDFLAVTFGFGYRPGERVENYPCVAMADTPLEILNRIDGKEQRDKGETI